MYQGIPFTPTTTLSQDINEVATRIYVADISVFPPAPNYASMFIQGTGVGETVKYNSIGTNFLDVVRGIEGGSQAWLSGTTIGRCFANKDLAAIQSNISDLNTTKVSMADVELRVIQTTGASATDWMSQNAVSMELANKAPYAVADRIYPGTDLITLFASEISAPPYNGNAWAWIKARVQAANFTGIHVGDYIPWVATNGYKVLSEVAGIDTYYNYSDSAVGHHIDFISRDCWPDTHAYNKANYNNGTTVSPNLWLASDIYAWLNSLSMSVPNAATANPALVTVNYTTTGVYDKLPAALQAVITTKRLLLPSRYTAGSLLIDDNSWAWADAGKLWVPSEVEVYGMEQWGSKNGYSGSGYQQYPIFATNMHRVKGADNGGARSNWWLSSAPGGDSTACAYVTNYGTASYYSASNTSIRVPVCFRVA